MSANQQDDATPPSIQIVLVGYLPLTRNQLKGTHWSVLAREKRRAAWALRDALESGLLSTQGDPPTGTDGMLRNSKTCLSRLGFWMAISGIFWKGRSGLKRFTRRAKKKQ